MTKDKIMQMAREAGAYSPWKEDDWAFDFIDLERFAALVAAAERDSMIEQGWRPFAKAIEAKLKEKNT